MTTLLAVIAGIFMGAGNVSVIVPMILERRRLAACWAAAVNLVWVLCLVLIMLERR